MPRIPLRLHSGTPPAPTPDPEGDKDWRRAHRPRPPPRGRSATRFVEHPPTHTHTAWPGPRRSRHAAAAPHHLFAAARGREVAGARVRGAAPACHLQSRPAPATPPSEPSARASASRVPWSRASATSFPSRGNHRPHRPAARPSTIPAVREVRAAPPSSCGLGLRSAEGTGAGPCLRTSTKEGCDARAAQPAQ